MAEAEKGGRSRAGGHAGGGRGREHDRRTVVLHWAGSDIVFFDASEEAEEGDGTRVAEHRDVGRRDGGGDGIPALDGDGDESEGVDGRLRCRWRSCATRLRGRSGRRGNSARGDVGRRDRYSGQQLADEYCGSGGAHADSDDARGRATLIVDAVLAAAAAATTNSADNPHSYAHPSAAARSCGSDLANNCYRAACVSSTGARTCTYAWAVPRPRARLVAFAWPGGVCGSCASAQWFKAAATAATAAAAATTTASARATDLSTVAALVGSTASVAELHCPAALHPAVVVDAGNARRAAAIPTYGSAAYSSSSDRHTPSSSDSAAAASTATTGGASSTIAAATDGATCSCLSVPAASAAGHSTSVFILPSQFTSTFHAFSSILSQSTSTATPYTCPAAATRPPRSSRLPTEPKPGHTARVVPHHASSGSASSRRSVVCLPSIASWAVSSFAPARASPVLPAPGCG